MSFRIEILVEEPSMEAFLRNLLPRILPKGIVVDTNCFIIPHQGKQDLRLRIPRRIRAYRHYPERVYLIVIQDQDSNDCVLLKQGIVDDIRQADAHVPALVRIACRELENWYLGDLRSVEMVYPGSRASKLVMKSKFRSADRLNGSDEMKNLSPHFSKIACARAMAKVIDTESGRSHSFLKTVEGIRSFVGQIDFGEN